MARCADGAPLMKVAVLLKMNRILSLVMTCCVAVASFAAPVRADAQDSLLEGAKLCTRHLARYEREYGVPTHLLSAIATTESGRYHDGLKIRVPWPWTINAEGKGYFFTTKDEAMAAVYKLRARGVTSIDVGCMQVNLLQHPHAFASLEQAFEPEQNIAYAASFLRGLYNDANSWKKAAADYHSKTPALGNQYVGLVYGSWYQIIDKLRAARLQVPAGAVTALNDMKMAPPVTRETTHAANVTQVKMASLKVARLPEQEGRKVSSYTSPHMNSIQVHRQADAGIIVVKPNIQVVDDRSAFSTPAVQTMTVAQATQAPAAAPDPNAVIIDNHRLADLPAPKKSGPTFIFSD
jgi:hypothetical protein